MYTEVLDSGYYYELTVMTDVTDLLPRNSYSHYEYY